MSVASWTGSLLAWEAELSALRGRLELMFGRRESTETGGAFLDGLLSAVACKTDWRLAEEAGVARPYRMQSLLGRSRWKADGLRDAVRAYAVEALGAADGVLVVDETGFLKKGTHSVGVARQYSGTAGRIENCQVGVFLSYAIRFGHALIDRRLCLPKDWADDSARRAEAAIPGDTGFMTKPEIARDLVTTVLDAGIPSAYVLADALYGSDKSLSVMLERWEQPHVLSVRSNERLMAGSLQTRTAAEIADEMVPGDWQRLAAGEGAKGPRLYDWARLRLLRLQERGQTFDHWLLVRRSLRAPEERACYVVFAPADMSLAELAGVAGVAGVAGEFGLGRHGRIGRRPTSRCWSGAARSLGSGVPSPVVSRCHATSPATMPRASTSARASRARLRHPEAPLRPRHPHHGPRADADLIESGDSQDVPVLIQDVYWKRRQADMLRALSLDLRVRVLKAVAEGGSHRGAAARFGVSAASVSRWRTLERVQGDARPGPLGGDRRSARIEAQGALIRNLLDETPDITTEELRVALAERGHRFGYGTIRRFFRRHGLTRKKRLGTRRSRTAPTS